MKRVIVTGANGFVGYWLVKQLCKQNVSVTAVIKDENENISMLEGFDNVEIVYCDLQEMEKLSGRITRHGFDAFYHLAWIAAGGAGRADYEVQLNNVKAACKAVKTAAELGCKKILFAGTITEKISENILQLSAKAQNNIYGICKHMTHCIVDIEAQKYGIDYIWMQFSNLYGPYSINGNIVGYTIKEVLSGNDALFGPAKQPYDLLYIEDLVYAAYLLGEKPTKDHCYYLGSGDVRTLADYLRQIGKLCGKEEKIKIGAYPDDGTRYDVAWFNIAPLVRDTGFAPRFTFDEGITKTVMWMKEEF